jgi:regulator of replication initiation timing
LKDKITKSNAQTIIKVGNTEMSVAAGIERKSGIVYEKRLLDRMRQNLAYVRDEVQDINENVNRRLDSLLESTLGSEGEKTSDQELIAKPFLKRNKAEVFDPLNLQNRINQLSSEIEEFEENIDIALSESNSTTFIEV